ncbi:hypothetical protein [Tuberibacillus sp. Marseille-P3662]|uniref:hypothetical protein n=1 Tax=Tuberibacillus sp. Marseille-P3662 TaxID=1965358 RepID=UPI000A1C7AE4|nr:hypothetical protein [Tuberibacillus sp. Marseille-P3662]
MKKSYLFLTIVFAFILIIGVGCSSKTSKDDHIAYISSNTNSDYVNTFKDLNLGILYDFDIEQPHADKSWVTVWVEGYRNGEKMDPFHLTEFSYGLSPKQKQSGHLGFGIISPNKTPSLFIYAPPGMQSPHKIKNNIAFSKGISMWDYAIGDGKEALDAGETEILGVYRQAKKSLETFDLQSEDAIKKIIKKDKMVLLLKIKVEKRNEAD